MRSAADGSLAGVAGASVVAGAGSIAAVQLGLVPACRVGRCRRWRSAERAGLARLLERLLRRRCAGHGGVAERRPPVRSDGRRQARSSRRERQERPAAVRPGCRWPARWSRPEQRWGWTISRSARRRPVRCLRSQPRERAVLSRSADRGWACALAAGARDRAARELGRLRFGCGRHVGRRRDRFGLMIMGGRLDRRLRRDWRRRARRLIRSWLRRVLHGVDLARQLVEAPHALGIGELVPVGAIESQRARGLERSDFSLMRELHRREQADRRHSQERGRQARADHKPEIRQHALTVSRQGLGACRGIADARPGPCHVEAGMPPSVICHVNA